MYFSLSIYPVLTTSFHYVYVPPLLPSMQIFTSAKASVSHTSVAFTAHYNARRSHTLIYSFLEKKDFLKVIKIKARIKGDRDYKIKFEIRSHYKVNFNLMCNNCTKTVKALCSYDAIPEHNSNVLIMRQIVFFFFLCALNVSRFTGLWLQAFGSIRKWKHLHKPLYPERWQLTRSHHESVRTFRL